MVMALDKLRGQIQGNTNALGGSTLAAPTSAFSGPSQTEQMQSLLSAKSGKAGAPTAGPKQSNLQEMQARQQTQNLLQQQAQQGQLAGVQISQEAEAQEQEVEQQFRILDEQGLDMAQKRAHQAQSILQQFSEGTRELDLRKQGAKMEQLGANLRLSSEKYLHNLTNEARKGRLYREDNFRQALIASVFSDEMDLLNSDLHFKSLLNADDRKFREEMAQFDIEKALDLAEAQSRQANSEALWTGVNELTKGGIQAADTYERRNPPKSPPPKSPPEE